MNETLQKTEIRRPFFLFVVTVNKMDERSGRGGGKAEERMAANFAESDSRL